MAKFKVKAGKHSIGRGEYIYAGGIVESDEDLCAVFPNKFEKAADDAEVTTPSDHPPEKVETAPAAEEAPAPAATPAPILDAPASQDE